MSCDCGPQKKPDEVEVTQYLPPDGVPVKSFAPVGDKHAQMAEGMVLSGEILLTGDIVLYARWKEQSENDEISELAVNEPGPNEPTEVLKRLIEQLKERGRG